MRNIDGHLNRFYTELKGKADKERFHENPSTHAPHTIFDGLTLNEGEKNLASHFSQHYKTFSNTFEGNPNLAIHSLARFGKIFAGNDSEHKTNMIGLLSKLAATDTYKDIIKQDGNKFHIAGFKGGKPTNTPENIPEDTADDSDATPLTHIPNDEDGEDLDIDKATKQEPDKPVNHDLLAHQFIEAGYKNAVLDENTDVEKFKTNFDADHILAYILSNHTSAHGAAKEKIYKLLGDDNAIRDLIEEIKEHRRPTKKKVNDEQN